MRKKIFSFITSLTMIFSLVLFLPSEITTNMVVSATNTTDVSNLNPVESTYSFIKSLEGCDLRCFWDVAQWTIGWGNKCPYEHSSKGTKVGQRGGHSISQDYADELFIDKLSGYVSTLKSNCRGLSMTQNQFDALLSATYNHGNVNSCPLKYYLQGTLSETEAREKYYVWCINAGSSTEKALRTRRKKEAELFFTDVEPIEPPKNCSISTDKTMYYVGEKVNFKFYVENSTEIYIPIDYNGTRNDFIDVSGKSNYSCTFNNPGVYGFFLYAKNSKGEASSVEDYKTITIYDKAPTNLSIKTNNNEYALGDDVTFNFDSMYDTELSIPIDYNGVRSDFIDVTNKKSLTYKFDKPGVYGYFLYAKNHYGESSTVDNYAQFTIYDEAPKDLKITNNKKAYKRNEKIKFQFNSKYAKELYIPIDFEGKRSDFIDVSGKTEFITQFDKVGNYGYFLYGRNEFGESSTVDDYIQFVVYDEGDCNNDGQFSVADVLMLQKWLLNDETELTNWQSADLDENGIIDVFDLCLMKQELINK